MAIDPAFCQHTNLKKSARIETISVPELGIEQLFLRVRVYCADCRAALVPRTQQCGFSTDEVGTIGEELLVPLDYPEVEVADLDDEEEPAPDRLGSQARSGKEALH